MTLYLSSAQLKAYEASEYGRKLLAGIRAAGHDVVACSPLATGRQA